MQVVILAAGRGDRFVKAGYEVPKPMILAHGRPMITHAMEQAAPVNGRPIVVCPDALKHDVWRAAPADVVPQVIGVRYTQSGAAMTLLAAAAALNEDDAVMLMDCDSVLRPGVLVKFAAYAERAFAAGRASATLCFYPDDDSARYSFVRLAQSMDDDFSSVAEVAEKVRISSLATCGVHAFASWRVLRTAMCEAVHCGAVTNGEVYTAPLHNYTAGGAVAYIVAPGDFTAIGTPEQLEVYERAVPEA